MDEELIYPVCNPVWWPSFRPASALCSEQRFFQAEGQLFLNNGAQAWAEQYQAAEVWGLQLPPCLVRQGLVGQQ